MVTIKRFEDILAWQKARELTKGIYDLTSSSEFSRDFGLKEQMRRASVSIMLNIAEGFARKTDKDFSKFLIQAHGSAAEVQSGLYVALDQGYVTQSQFDYINKKADEISAMTMKLSHYLSEGNGIEKQ